MITPSPATTRPTAQATINRRRGDPLTSPSAVYPASVVVRFLAEQYGLVLQWLEQSGLTTPMPLRANTKTTRRAA
jgi:hypothetical protein